MKLDLSSLSNEQIAVLKYALDMYEDSVDGDRTIAFIEAFYELKTKIYDEYRDRDLNHKDFYKGTW